MERRCLNGKVESVSGRTIRGMAIVYDVLSRKMKDKDGVVFVERIMKEAVTEDILRKNDIKALLEHDDNRLLARSRNGEGSLRLRATEEGVEFEFEAPNTPTGDEAVELVKRGDICACSFAFWGAKSSWKKEDDMIVRSIESLPNIDDITLTCRPAYEDTSVDVRSVLKDEQDVASKDDTKDKKSLQSYYNEIEMTL